MKSKFITVLIPLSLLCAGSAFAETTSCASQINNLQQQIDSATKAGNHNEVISMQKALAETRQHCTEAGQLERAKQKIVEEKEDVRKAGQEVSEATSSLQEARAKGASDKILKAENKLTEKQAKLARKTDDLKAAEADLSVLQK